MYFLIGVIFVSIGFIMLIKPQIIFYITEKWKNSSNGEPSHLYIISIKFGGVMFLIIGFASIIIQFF